MRFTAETAAVAVVVLASVGVIATAFVRAGGGPKPSVPASASYGAPPASDAHVPAPIQFGTAQSSPSDEEAAIRKAIAERPCAPAFTIDGFRITDRDPDPQVPDGEQLEARIEISRTANFDAVLNSAGCTFTLLGSMAGLRALQEAPSATVMLLAKTQKREAGWRVNELALATE